MAAVAELDEGSRRVRHLRDASKATINGSTLLQEGVPAISEVLQADFISAHLKMLNLRLARVASHLSAQRQEAEDFMRSITASLEGHSPAMAEKLGSESSDVAEEARRRYIQTTLESAGTSQPSMTITIPSTAWERVEDKKACFVNSVLGMCGKLMLDEATMRTWNDLSIERYATEAAVRLGIEYTRKKDDAKKARLRGLYDAVRAVGEWAYSAMTDVSDELEETAGGGTEISTETLAAMSEVKG
jgi:hypothetical protein